MKYETRTQLGKDSKAAHNTGIANSGA